MINEENAPLAIALLGGFITLFTYLVFDLIPTIFISLFIGFILGLSARSIRLLAAAGISIMAISVFGLTAYYLATTSSYPVDDIFIVSLTVFLALIIPASLVYRLFAWVLD